MRIPFLAVVFLVVSATLASAHYHILLPDRHSVKSGDKVTVTYQFGHPFEHVLSDTDKPVRAVTFNPDRKSVDLLPSFEKVEVPGQDGKKVAGYRVVFQPDRRGDFTLLVESPPVWMEDEKHFIRDVCRVVIHVEAQKGWDLAHSRDDEFTAVPMTRPYGLRAGTVFQTRIQSRDSVQPVAHLVEVERYNPIPPKVLPPDEHITLSLKTDLSGVATCSLPDPGWWAITATRQLALGKKAETKERDGKPYPVVDRATIWVPVDDKLPQKPAD
jgi:uncharacterized GH25 family protein